MTGTFDEWSKSVQLDKVGDVFQKTVTIPDASAKIYYKVGGQVQFLADIYIPTPRSRSRLSRFRLPIISPPILFCPSGVLGRIGSAGRIGWQG